jgi:hypothetical protein
MHNKIAPALAITILIVSGCSGGHKEFGTAGLLPQTPGGPVALSSCGSAIFDPVPVLDCAGLPVAAPAASIDALPGGYWSGQFVDHAQAVQGYMVALVSEDGRFQIQAYRYNDNNLCHNWDAELSGRMTTAGNSLNGSGRIFAIAPTLVDGTTAADLQIDGVVAERDSISGTWNASSGDSGCFQLGYDWGAEYETPSTLANLAGEWTANHSAGSSRLSVEADGSLSGSDRYGCIWTGHFGLIDERYSFYEFEAELQACDRAGRYTGLAWHTWGWDPGEFWLQVLADDGEQALTFAFSNR